MKKRLTVAFWCLGLVTPLWAQMNVDSLEARLEETAGGERLALLADLVEALSLEDPDAALLYGREAVSMLTEQSGADIVRRVWYWKGRAHERAKQQDSVLIQAERLERWAKVAGNSRGQADAAYLKGIGFLMTDSYEAGLESMEIALEGYGTIHDKRGIAESLAGIGSTYQDRGDYDEALSFYRRSLAVQEEIGDTVAIGALFTNIGNVHSRQGDYDEALSAYTRSLIIKEALGDRRGVGSTLMNIGNVHYNQGSYDDALDYFMRSLAIDEEFGDKQRMARSLNNIGGVLFSRGDYSKALGFFTRSLTIKEELGDKRGIANSLSNIGEAHRAQGRYDEALDFFLRSLALDEELGDKWGLAYSLSNIANVHRETGSYKEALNFFTRSLTIREEVGDKRGSASTLMSVGALYRLQGRPDDALSATAEALAIALDINGLDLIRDVYEERTLIYEQQGRYAEALESHRQYKAAHDSLFNSESESVIAELQERYRTKEQQQQIQLLQQRQKIQRMWLAALVGGLLLLSVIAFLAHNRYRLKNRAHAELALAHSALQRAHDQLRTTQQQLIHAEKMASLGALTAGIAHEIKNPLNFVTNFSLLSVEMAAELDEAFSNGEDVRDLLQQLRQNANMIDRHARRADGIVRAMMQHASGGTGRREPIEVNQLVSEYTDLAYHGKRAQEPDLRVEIIRNLGEDVGAVELVSEEMGRVLLNLLSNAFDAVHERTQELDREYKPTVTISTRRVGGQVEIRVSDNGRGIPETIIDRVFEPFFTTKPTGSGTGLGLGLSYDIVTQGHEGKLTIESEVGQGATFIVALPTGSTGPDPSA